MIPSRRRNPASSRFHRLRGPPPPPPEPTPAERRAAERAEQARERGLKTRMRAALERRRADYRRRRGCPPDVHWNYVQALRASGSWCGDDDPDWSLPSWMLSGYDPMDDRAYWLGQIGETAP